MINLNRKQEWKNGLNAAICQFGTAGWGDCSLVGQTRHFSGHSSRNSGKSTLANESKATHDTPGRGRGSANNILPAQRQRRG